MSNYLRRYLRPVPGQALQIKCGAHCWVVRIKGEFHAMFSNELAALFTICHDLCGRTRRGYPMTWISWGKETPGPDGFVQYDDKWSTVANLHAGDPYLRMYRLEQEHVQTLTEEGGQDRSQRLVTRRLPLPTHKDVMQ